VLGTRSIVVASAADCSVVVVPEENLALRHGVIVGVAPGDQSHVAIVAGAREAERLGQELSLIHVVPDTTESAEIGRALLAEAAGIASATAPGITIRRRVSRRRRSDALLDASRSASMLVLGETRVNKDRAGFIGSVTHEVLLNLTSPVMVAR
jgi:nucleotide-binding universal stress UspA family protein